MGMHSLRTFPVLPAGKRARPDTADAGMVARAAEGLATTALGPLATERLEQRLRVRVVRLHVSGDVIVRCAANAIFLRLLIAVVLPLTPIPVRDRHALEPVDIQVMKTRRRLGREEAGRERG